MPWHSAEDMRHFKRVTMGHPVVMGRKTYESLGRPLPGRTNVVITRNPDRVIPGCRIVSSLEEALNAFPPEEEVFVIGGSEIYRQTLSLADKIYLTEVHADFEGDAFFPPVNPADWEEMSRESMAHGEHFDKPFDFVEYRRR